MIFISHSFVLCRCWNIFWNTRRNDRLIICQIFLESFRSYHWRQISIETVRAIYQCPIKIVIRLCRSITKMIFIAMVKSTKTHSISMNKIGLSIFIFSSLSVRVKSIFFCSHSPDTIFCFI